MNMYDLLQTSSGVNITINAGQLVEAIDYCVEKTRKELELKIEKEKRECYLSPDDVCAKLSVTRSILWRYEKEGYLIPVRVGGKVKYASSKIDELLKMEA